MSFTIQVNNLSGFDEYKKMIVDKKKTAFVMFYAKGCHFCDEMKPEWKEMKKVFKNNTNFIFVEIKSDYAKKVIETLKNELNLLGFPHITVIQNNKAKKEYNNSADAQKLINYVIKKIPNLKKKNSHHKRRTRKKRTKKRSHRTRRRRTRRKKTRRYKR